MVHEGFAIPTVVFAFGRASWRVGGVASYVDGGSALDPGLPEISYHLVASMVLYAISNVLRGRRHAVIALSEECRNLSTRHRKNVAGCIPIVWLLLQHAPFFVQAVIQTAVVQDIPRTPSHIHFGS